MTNKAVKLDGMSQEDQFKTGSHAAICAKYHLNNFLTLENLLFYTNQQNILLNSIDAGFIMVMTRENDIQGADIQRLKEQSYRVLDELWDSAEMLKNSIKKDDH